MHAKRKPRPHERNAIKRGGNPSVKKKKKQDNKKNSKTHYKGTEVDGRKRAGLKRKRPGAVKCSKGRGAQRREKRWRAQEEGGVGGRHGFRPERKTEGGFQERHRI